MRGVENGKKFEKIYINKNSKSKQIDIDKVGSNGYNDYCEDSYLNSKYYMTKIYKNGTVLNTRTDEHKKGMGQGKLISVEITGDKV